jgi:hypothetical protein
MIIKMRALIESRIERLARGAQLDNTLDAYVKRKMTSIEPFSDNYLSKCYVSKERLLMQCARTITCETMSLYDIGSNKLKASKQRLVLLCVPLITLCAST